MVFKLEVEDGKYTFVNDNGIVKILRYGDEWQDETGNKALLCLLQKVEQYQRDKVFDESIMRDYEKALQEKEEEIQRLETELMMLR